MISGIKEKLQLLTPGHHGCFYYYDLQNAIETTLVFLQIGLERNERCIYLASPEAIAKTKSLFKQTGFDLIKEAQKCRLALFSDRDFLVNGRFEMDHMIKFIDQAIQEALRAGFTGLRGVGDVFWEMGPDQDMIKLTNYEKKLDEVLSKQKATILCQYDLKAIRPKYVRDSLFSHNAVIEPDHVCVDNHFHNSLYDFPRSSFDLMCKSLRQ